MWRISNNNKNNNNNKNLNVDLRLWWSYVHGHGGLEYSPVGAVGITNRFLMLIVLHCVLTYTCRLADSFLLYCMNYSVDLSLGTVILEPKCSAYLHKQSRTVLNPGPRQRRSGTPS